MGARMTKVGSNLFPTSFGRFEDSYMPEPNTGCWIWTKYVNRLGYGVIRVNKKTWLANRFSYRIFKGDFDQSLYVCHKCDVPSCVNPDHLFLGTLQDNIKDRDDKGRCQKGQTHFRSKLTEIHIQVIREAISKGYKNKTIGEYFKVKQHTISGIKTGKTWKHI